MTKLGGFFKEWGRIYSSRAGLQILHQADASGQGVAGAGTLTWTASASTPDWTELKANKGSTQNRQVLYFTLKTAALGIGIHPGEITIDGGEAGKATMVVRVHVAAAVNSVYMPVMMR